MTEYSCWVTELLLIVGPESAAAAAAPFVADVCALDAFPWPSFQAQLSFPQPGPAALPNTLHKSPKGSLLVMEHLMGVSGLAPSFQAGSKRKDKTEMARCFPRAPCPVADAHANFPLY